jgi:Ser/Thr protein kinase RdoA (MazF antagonist)
MSDVYWVNAPRKLYVVKIYHHEEEHWRRARVNTYALRFFYECALPVPRLIANRSGEDITTIQSAEGDRALIGTLRPHGRHSLGHGCLADRPCELVQNLAH